MISAYNILDNTSKTVPDTEKERLTFNNMADMFVDLRQQVNKDAIILIGGFRGNGKSTWNIKLMKPLIKKIQEHNPEFKFNRDNQKHWELHYSKDRMEAIKKLEKKLIPPNSFHIVDEGGDIALSGNAMERDQKLLQQVILKTRDQYHITLISIPQIFKLDKTIREEACLCVIVDYRYLDVCSFAFVFRRSSSSLSMDRFGIDSMRKFIESRKGMSLRYSAMMGKIKVRYKGKMRDKMKKENIIDSEYIYVPFDKQTFDFYLKQPNCIGVMRFREADKEWYASYKKFIKDKAMERVGTTKLITKEKYDKLKYAHSVLLYNLIIKADMKYSFLEALHIDPAGVRLMSASTIKKRYEEIDMRAHNE